MAARCSLATNSAQWLLAAAIVAGFLVHFLRLGILGVAQSGKALID
ncbi:hypothetical protein TUN199_06332 [Pyrenophora tritici-repentis]|nr:hypothetical protein Alg215_07147 [Pyrenophora tritici-repentis]KAI0582218.1 hypothetical protein Alg130_06258 [Pyrenophora tritici-repentis]KAI0612917.1 hypothetical protein TUN205_02838 [Pyrenophora tritici-repentis]KAI0621651.1 hypothetical protein TUN199_06332 [Pyrenophora tritici-repentis]